MKKILFLLLLVVSSFALRAQTPTGIKTRVPALYVQYRDTATATSADTACVFYFNGRLWGNGSPGTFFREVVTTDATGIDSIVGVVSLHSARTGNIRYFKPAANTDVARGAAITAARDASDTSDHITVGPGNYLRTTAIKPKRGQTWDLTTARIYKAVDTFDIFRLDSVSYVTIMNGKLVGSGHSYGTPTQTMEAGIRSVLNTTGIVTGLRFKDITMSGFKGPGIYVESEIQSGDSSRYFNGEITGIQSIDNGYGAVVKSGYWHIMGNNLSGCDSSIIAAGANGLYANNNATYNRHGPFITGGGDHSIWDGNNLNHNLFDQVHFKDIQFGLTFSNNHVFGSYLSSNDTLGIIENSKGVNIVNCLFGQGNDLTIKISLRGATPGYNSIRNTVYVGANPTIYGTTLQKSYLIIDDTRRTDSAVSYVNTAKELGIRNLNTTGIGSFGSISTTTVVATGSISTTNLTATGAITGTTLGGTITTALQPNITLVGTLSNLTVTGTFAAASAGFGGSVSVGSLTSANTGIFLTTVAIGSSTADIIGYGTNGILGIRNATDAPSIQMGIIGTGGNTADNLGDINATSQNGTGSVVARQLIRSRLDGAVNSTAWDRWTMNAGSLSKKEILNKTGDLTLGSVDGTGTGSLNAGAGNFNGGLYYKTVQSQTTSFSSGATIDQTATFWSNAATGSVSVTLPSASGHNRIYTIRYGAIAGGGNTLTVNSTGGESIYNKTTAATSYVMAAGDVIQVQSDGSSWIIIAKN